MERKIAFLVYPAWREPRRKNKSFDGLSNIGAYMLMDVGSRAGLDIRFCSVDSARSFDVVLVSLTSIYDVLSFYKEVRRHPDWQRGKRKFRVLAGGFGMQNPFPILDYCDSFWFGRCEDDFVNWVTIDDYEHPSLMTPDKPKVCRINQSSRLYPHQFELHTGMREHDCFTERIMGCPNKCMFCHFSFARKHINTGEHYNLAEYSKASQELDMFNLEDISPTCGKITIGLDGISERLRYRVNKPISDEKVRDTIVHISNITRIKGEALFLKLYNIAGYETENEKDYADFAGLFDGLAERMKKRVIVILHTTPLHPSPATPLVYSAVNLHTDFENKRGRTLADYGEKLLVLHSRYNASNFATLESLVVERFMEKYRALLDMLCFNAKFNALKAAHKVRFIEDKFDVRDLVRAYGTDEQVPSWVCESYVGWDMIKRMRDIMLKKDEVYAATKG